jgi:branched-chain amino acid transport system permease protein
LAGIYFLISFGITLLYGVGGFPNLAIGPIGLTGAYTTITLIRGGTNVVAAIIAGMSLAIILGILIQRYVVESLYNAVGGGERGRLFVIYGTFGLVLLFPPILINVFRSTMVTVNLPRLGAIQIIGFLVHGYQIVSVALAVLLLVISHISFSKTLGGNQVRGVTQNPLLARLVGIRVRRIYLITSALASAFAFLGAILWGELFNLNLGSGVIFTLYGFIIAVMGGLGSIYGALIVSLVLGIALSATSFLIGGVYEHIITTLLLIVVLLFRPMGVVPTRREI